MDEARAAELLETERKEVVALLDEVGVAGDNDRDGANEQGDMADSEESLTDEEQESAVAEGLRLRLATIERAQQRLRDGTYGRSVRSGEPIPDERLEADPAAELTVDEALEP
jgi:DnaK suppressor protein